MRNCRLGNGRSHACRTLLRSSEDSSGAQRFRFPGLIHHSDRGSQYAGGKYRKLIGKAHLTQSMSRKDECLDNAPMDSFFASLKNELVHRQRFNRARRLRLLSLNTSRFSATSSVGILASATKHLCRLLKI